MPDDPSQAVVGSNTRENFDAKANGIRTHDSDALIHKHPSLATLRGFFLVHLFKPGTAAAC